MLGEGRCLVCKGTGCSGSDGESGGGVGGGRRRLLSWCFKPSLAGQHIHHVKMSPRGLGGRGGGENCHDLSEKRRQLSTGGRQMLGQHRDRLQWWCGGGEKTVMTYNKGIIC